MVDVSIKIPAGAALYLGVLYIITKLRNDGDLDILDMNMKEKAQLITTTKLIQFHTF